MSNDEKFDLIINKLDELGGDVKELKEDVSVLKEDVIGLKEDVSVLKENVSRLNENMIKLEKMDALILDEVERVHDIMIKRTDDLYTKMGYPKVIGS